MSQENGTDPVVTTTTTTTTITKQSSSVETNVQHENPFQANGELSRKADYIISHSRISRTEVMIADPDSPQPTQENEEKMEDATRVAEVTAAVPPLNNSGVEGPTTAAGQKGSVEVEVKRKEPNPAGQSQKAEQVKLKSNKCCSVQ